MRRRSETNDGVFGGAFGQEDSTVCTPQMLRDDPNADCTCPSGTIYMNDRNACVDPSVMCGPGTQWVAADNACVPLTKYMAPAQIAAATKAGVNLTGGGPAIVPMVAPRQPPAMVPTPSAMAKLAGMFGGHGLLVAGGVAALVLVAAVASKSR